MRRKHTIPQVYTKSVLKHRKHMHLSWNLPVMLKQLKSLDTGFAPFRIFFVEEEVYK